MSIDKLTPQEQELAAENHGLLISFMQRYQLDDELYGSLSLRYLKTVHRYLTDPELSRYQFSTILWMNLRSELSHELRKASRTPVLIPLEERPNAASIMDDEGLEELWERLEKLLTKRELEVLYLRTQGQSYREIAKACNLTFKAVAGRLYRLKKKIRKL